MDPTTTLWIVSILAAAGFTATGYFLARFRAEEAKPIAVDRDRDHRDRDDDPTPIVPAVVAKSIPPAIEEPIPPPPVTLPQFSAGPRIPTPEPRGVTGPPPPITVTGPPPPVRTARPPPVQDLAKTKPPPPIHEVGELVDVSHRSRDARMDPDGGEPHLVDHDYSALERDLRTEASARREAEKRAADLMSRLVSSSQQIAALRAKLGMSDDGIRSIPPTVSRMSERPAHIQSKAPGLFSEIEDLRREVDRLRSENETLRVAAFMKRQQ